MTMQFRLSLLYILLLPLLLLLAILPQTKKNAPRIQ